MSEREASIDPTADVHDRAYVGSGTKVWHLVQIREDAEIGANCVIGRGVYIGAGVVVGDSCKIQNHALVYEPAVLEDGVFVGPAAVLTNDRFPRAVNTDGSPKAQTDWDPVGVLVRHGASLGAQSLCVAPVTVGEWAVVAAGAVVTRDVEPHALVAGCPAVRIGWVCRCGHRLGGGEQFSTWVCDDCGLRYEEDGGTRIVLQGGEN